MITYTTDPEGTGYAVSYLLPIQIYNTQIMITYTTDPEGTG